jgi:hypothetical protein
MKTKIVSTMEYYSATKRSGPLIYTVTLIILTRAMLVERTKQKRHTLHGFICMIIGKDRSQMNRLGGAQGGRGY